MSLLSLLKKPFVVFADLLYPKTCPVCHASVDLSDGIVCGKCVGKIVFFCSPLCPRCGRHVSVNHLCNNRCENCVHEEFLFDRVLAVGIYGGVLKECIHAFKFGKKEYLGAWFADVMVSCLRQNDVDLGRYDVIIPVPMHPVKRKERGFNQAEVLSRHLSARLAVPFYSDVLWRKIEGKVQSSLSRKERFQNVTEAFQLRRHDVVRDRRLILVDDIYTTGATASACAAMLKRYGAQEVAILVIARGV